MGRMKDIAIGMMEDHEYEQGDLFIDEELRTLIQNFKPSLEELQAELDETQAHNMSLPSVSVQPEVKVYLLMKNGYPVRSYTDRALSFYECWICTKGDEYAEEPDDYYIVEMMHDTSIYTGE
jgi:hypothetical protein